MPKPFPLLLSLASAALFLAADSQTHTPVFLCQKIDGPSPNWYGPFSEGAAVFDVNNDGVLDITAGANWYEGPKFIKHSLREATPHGEFVNNCGEYPYDVNGDGWTDIVSAGWMEDGIYWFENNHGEPGLWTKHKIADSTQTEGLIFEDVDGDGDPDIIPNHYLDPSHPRQREVYWIEFDKGTFIRHSVGPHGDQHGAGLGDLDGDGRKDIITPVGWYRAPSDPRRGSWEWHPEYDIQGLGGIRMLVYDVNGDGKNDIIFGMGHNYGLFWLEQKVEAGTRSWIRHTIEDDWSQAHTLVLADVNGDGRLDLVTGKRLRGHEENDPGSFEPLGVYWYDINPRDASFTKHVITYNSMTGTGMNINVLDIDKDGDPDIVVGGKSGLFLLENMTVFKKRTPQIIQR
jgi:hypothetical protein